MVFVFGSVYVMDYIYGFVYVELALPPRDEANLILMDKLLDGLLDSVCRIFASMFITDIGLKFSFLVVSLPGFGIRMMLVLQKELERLPSFCIVWNSFNRNATCCSLYLVEFGYEPIWNWTFSVW